MSKRMTAEEKLQYARERGLNELRGPAPHSDGEAPEAAKSEQPACPASNDHASNGGDTATDDVEAAAARIATLASLDPIAYARRRKAEALTLGIGVSILDAEVKRARRLAANGRPVAQPHDVDAESDGNDLDEAITRLAGLSLVEYERVRKAEAEALGVRPQVLDKLVTRAHSRAPDAEAAGRPLEFATIEAWDEPVDDADLLDELAAVFRRYVILPDHAAEVAALWVVYTYVFDCFDVSPLLAVTSPQKRCGKTQFMTVLSRLVRRPLPTSNVLPAALFRMIERHLPTVLVDEGDTFLQDNEPLRGILNSGHTRAFAYVVRSVGDDHEPRLFSTWAPKALALIGSLPGTLGDRSIPIPLRRKLTTERVHPLRQDTAAESFEMLRRRCVRWAMDNEATLRSSRPVAPEGLNDRAADNCLPLIAIANASGGVWPEIARKALCGIHAAASDDDDGDTLAVLLLSDIRNVFDLKAEVRVSTRDLLDELNAMEDRPWVQLGRGNKGLTGHRLSRMLTPFDIHPKQLGGSGNPRGYERSAFEDAWMRYLPVNQSATPLHPATDAGLRDAESATANADVALRYGGKSSSGADSSTSAFSNGDARREFRHGLPPERSEEDQTDYEERAAICEYDGKLPRDTAERVAGKQTVKPA